MDFYDSDDLLGNSQMPIRQQQRSLLSTLFYYSLYLLPFLFLWVAFIYGRNYHRNWLENNCKKAVRRKYGIPDDNNEPFNVAYAKAEQKRRELARIAAHQEAAARAPKRPSPPPVVVIPEPRYEAPPPKYEAPFRNRSTVSGITLNLSKPAPPWNPSLYSTVSPGGTTRYLHYDTSKHGTKAKQDFFDLYSPGSPKQRKRSLEKDDLASSKKSRKDSPRNRAISIDITDLENRNASLPRPSRGSKRQAGPEEEIANVGSIGKKAGKRARRHSKKIHETITIDEENDQPMDLDRLSRGKKRDRNEAGSSFGGEEDSHVNSHGRKKRSQKRKSNTSSDADAAVQARGTKRSYEIESTLGSDEEDSNIRNPKTSRKRGKRMEIEVDSESDVSMEDLDASCAGRKIGEEWNVNGELFKVGPDGRRLRAALVRKRKSRFSMPEDSEHPDTMAQYEILIETWLNDEDYDNASRRDDIFIPDKRSTEPTKTVTKEGKQLLWNPPNRNTKLSKSFNNSYIREVGLDSNPFDRPSKAVPGRRIGISADFTPPPRPAPSVRGARSYSKWEKQDLEAQALATLQKKLDSEKKEEPTPILKKVAFDVPPSTGSSPTPPIASAPVLFPAPSAMPSTNGPTPATNGFAFPTSNGNISSASAQTDSVMSSIEPTQPNMPSFSVTPPQPAKEPATGPAKPLFGNSPFNAQPATSQSAATISENKAQSPFGGQTNGMSFSTPAPNPFGTMKSQTPSATAPTPSVNMFGTMPTAPSTFSNQTSNGMNGSPSVFSSGNKPAAQTPFSAFGAPSSNGFTPNMSASASGTASNNSASPFTLGGSSNQQPNLFNKPAEQHAPTSASAAPKFSFSNLAKPAGSLPSQTPAPVAAAAPKPAPSPFGGFASNSTPSTSAMSGISTPTSSATTSTPKFSFGATSAASTSAAPATTNGFSNNTNGTATSSKSTTATPAASGFSNFKFGPVQPIASPFGNPSSAPSPFGAAPNSSAPSPFGTTPFGVSAKQNGEAPKPSFGTTASDKAEGKPQFSFNFGAAAPSSTPAFGTTPMQNGNPFGFTVPVNGSTNGFGSSAFGQK